MSTTKIEITGVELIAAMRAILRLRTVRGTVEFARRISALDKALRADALKLQTAYNKPMPADAAWFDQKRMAIAHKYCAKDSDGNPSIVGNEYVIINRESYEAEFQALRDAHPTNAESYDVALKERMGYLNASYTVMFEPLSITLIPDLSADELQALDKFLAN